VRRCCSVARGRGGGAEAVWRICSYLHCWPDLRKEEGKLHFCRDTNTCLILCCIGLFNRLTSESSRINCKGLLFVALLARWQHESERFCDRPSRYMVSWNATVASSIIGDDSQVSVSTNASNAPDFSSSKWNKYLWRLTNYIFRLCIITKSKYCRHCLKTPFPIDTNSLSLCGVKKFIFHFSDDWGFLTISSVFITWGTGRESTVSSTIYCNFTLLNLLSCKD